MREQSILGRWKKASSDRGLLLRGKVWYIRFADQFGKIHTERVGPSKAYAAKVYRLRKTSAMERKFVPASGTMWDELVKDVTAIAEQRHRFKRGEGRFTPAVTGVVGRWFAGRRADTITTQEIEEHLASTKTPGTFNRKRTAVHHIFQLGIRKRKVLTNPVAPIPAQREDNSRVRYLNQNAGDEEERLRSAIRKLCPDREPEVDLALHTGLRWSEQYGLKWADVDLLRRQITLASTKAGKKQYLPINGAAHAALAKLRMLYPQSLLVCPGAGYYNDHKRKFWQPVVKEAKLTDFRWHDLRHTFASRLVMAGVDIFTVSKLLRHGQVSTSERYAHLSVPHLAAAIEKLDLPSVTVGVQQDRKSQYLQ